MFIAILILDLYHDITIRKMEEHERRLLINRAYTDELTLLNNRRFCTEYMNELDSDEKGKYTIISFDLNDLKKINDEHGHVQGDLIIKSAAGLIEDVFSASGIVGRIGGDEFIAILSTEDTTYVDALLEQLNQRVEEANQGMPELNLSISYGYATKSESEAKVTEYVYQLSDDRMYEHKRIYKQQGE